MTAGRFLNPEKSAKSAPRIIAVLFAIVCAVGLWRVVATLGLHVSFDPNEGWNAYHARAAFLGHGLYPPRSSLFVNNYPPLSFYVVGAIGKVLGDAILAGRIVSLLSFLVIAAAIWKVARSMRCGEIPAAIAALFFMACLLVGSDYVGMNDPELLAHALQVAALLVALQRPGQTLLAALLFVLAFFFKHNLVAMPLALAIWFAQYDRARAIRFIVTGLVGVFAGLLLFRLVYGTDLIAELASPRTYALSLLAGNLESWLVWGAIPLLIVAALVMRHGRDESVSLCALYAGLSILIGILFSGGAGVDTNVFFDADIALSLGVALALDRLSDRGVLWPAAISISLLVPLTLGVYSVSDADWHDAGFWLHPMTDERVQSHGDIAFLEAHRGRAVCETLALCYWAGKEAEVDMFNIGQAYATRARSDTGLIRLLNSRAFSVLEFDTLEPFALGPGVRTAVLGTYRIDHQNDEGVFLVPR